MGLFDTIRRAVGADDSSTDGDERAAAGDRPSDDGPALLDTATLDPTTFREYAERVVDGADPLTFDPDALARLDTAIEESYGGETVGDAAGPTTYTENTVRFGSYLGDLLVRAYGGEWVQSDGRWGVTVAGPDNEVTVAVFDVAARSFGDEPVFAAVVTRLESELALDTAGGTDDKQGDSETDDTDADSAVSEPTRVVSRVDDGQADERDAPPEPAATEGRDEATAADSADSGSTRPVETEPTRVVRRAEPDSPADDRADGTDPTPVVSRVADEPETEAPPDDADGSSSTDEDADSDTTDSASDAAGSEPPAGETAGKGSTADSGDAGSAGDAAEQSADDTADEQPPAETPAAESAIDASEDGPTADTTETVETPADDTVTPDEVASYIDEAEPTVDGDTAAPSDEAPASEPRPEESPVGSRDGDRTADASAGVASDTSTDEAATDTGDAGAPSEGSPDPAAPAEDVEASDATGNAPSRDAAADSKNRAWDAGTVRADHAETAVEFADFWGEHDLDFSTASLSRLDDLVDAEWDDDRFAETTFGSEASFDDRAFTSVVRELGGYFGEVLVRQLDGEWTDETDHEAAVVVGGPAGEFAVPVFEVAVTSLRTQAVFGRSYDALLADLGRDGPAR